MGILHAVSNCIRETFNHGLSLSEVDWGDPKGEPTKMLKYTASGNTLMEFDWGAHETHPNGHNISEVDWGGHDSSSNYMNGFMLSEVDWGAHDSSFFLFLVNIDYDAKAMEFFTQGLWGELQQTMSSTPLIGHMTDSLDTGQTEDDAFSPKPIDPELDDLNNLLVSPSSPIPPW